MKARFFSYLVEKVLFFGDAGIGFGQTFTYDRKIVLGESLKFLIGELKLSYRKVSTIIGESLAAMRRWAVLFVAESSMKPCFFELFLRFYITFCVFS